MKRVLTAALLVVVAIAAAFAPAWVFACLLVPVALLAMHELYGLAAAAGLEPFRGVGYVAGAAVVLVVALPPNVAGAWIPAGSPLQIVLLGALMAILLRVLFRAGRMAESLADAAVTLFGLFYPALLLALLGWIQQAGGGGWLTTRLPGWLIWLFLVVWLGDVAALYVGRAFGKHGLAPRLSPNKTWEGALASLVVALGASLGWGLGVGLEASRGWMVRCLLLLGLAAATNFAAQAGDLLESLFKRGAQRKDSGALLPGHGGVLDRIDALLLAAPVLWYYLSFHV